MSRLSAVGLALLASAFSYFLWSHSRIESAPVIDRGGEDAGAGELVGSSPESLVRQPAPPRPAAQGADAGAAKTQLERLLAMHLAPAPRDLQDVYLLVAEREQYNLQANADQLAGNQADGVNSYLEYLACLRDAEMRGIAHRALLHGRGVLVIEGLDANKVSEFVAGRPTVRYFGVASYFGRRADLLVAMDADADEDSRRILTDLTESIDEVALGALREFVARFNLQSREDREKALSGTSSGGLGLGMNAKLECLVGNRVVRHEESALLSVR